MLASKTNADFSKRDFGAGNTKQLSKKIVREEGKAMKVNHL